MIVDLRELVSRADLFLYSSRSLWQSLNDVVKLRICEGPRGPCPNQFELTHKALDCLCSHSQIDSCTCGNQAVTFVSEQCNFAMIAFKPSFHWTPFALLARDGKREALISGMESWKVMARRSSSFCEHTMRFFLANMTKPPRQEFVGSLSL